MHTHTHIHILNSHSKLNKYAYIGRGYSKSLKIEKNGIPKERSNDKTENDLESHTTKKKKRIICWC
jgi:hypothetical protein